VRILIVHSRYLSGPASGENRVVEDEARLLSEGGHDVHVWSPEPDAGGPAARLRLGLETIWSAHAATELRRRIAKVRVDVVHGHNLFPTISPSVIRVAAEEGVPFVLTLHNYRLLCLPATLLRDGDLCEDCVGRTPWPGVLHRCYRGSALGSGALALSIGLHRWASTFDRVSLFLAVGGFVRDKHIAGGVPADRIRVKSNFTWPTSRREGPGNYYLYIGRLAREKGIDTILEAWRDAPGQLLVVGDGPDARRLRGAATPHVRFLDGVPAEEVASLIRGARALVLPSVWYEGQPRVVLEAYAAGVPVIASRIGGLQEVVIDGRTGLLTDPGEATSWIRAATIIADDNECVRLGNGAFAEWAQRYTPEQAIRELESAYADAIARGATMG
jgi:glycosyltransferase involved in cell wall biosynthesis